MNSTKSSTEYENILNPSIHVADLLLRFKRRYYVYRDLFQCHTFATKSFRLY